MDLASDSPGQTTSPAPPPTPPVPPPLPAARESAFRRFRRGPSAALPFTKIVAPCEDFGRL